MQSCPVRSLNSATASILGQSGMSESATVHCFSFVRALISLHLEVWNSLLIKAFILWKDIGRSMHCKIVVPFLASVSTTSMSANGEPIEVLPVTRSIASMGVDFIPPVISRNAWLCAFSSGLRVTSVAVMSGTQQ
ncbi:unnamed protein product [Rodentolepis nana]|uniref:Secreted protein n=1 Tax=Rodentolepis nana TaxID=102285 RepID=A0A0R3T3J7_RODNA|nr:unnamed protein product [Rodentolepis nana]